MRYYVLNQPTFPDLRPYIEGVFLSDDPDDCGESPAPVRENMTAASGLLRVGGKILTEDELLASPEGRRALHDWRAGDDSQHIEEVRRWLAEDRAQDALMLARRHPGLRVVKGEG